GAGACAGRGGRADADAVGRGAGGRAHGGEDVDEARVALQALRREAADAADGAGGDGGGGPEVGGAAGVGFDVVAEAGEGAGADVEGGAVLGGFHVARAEAGEEAEGHGDV